MNKHLFRVIFNKARGMRMVVQETASSGGGQASDGATPAGGGGRGFALKPVAAALALLLGSQAGLAQILPDRTAPGRQRPTVLNSANGTPTVNIQTPSAAGVSRNSYRQFDIGAKGAILNNSRTAVQSRIGGWIQGNGSLARGSARVIVNEVNASAASRLMGALEVAGQRADVIVANPAGLVVDGLSLINAAGVTLTTGRPLYGAGGGVDGFSVQSGLIHTQGLGLDATEADYAHILARAVSLNAGVWAQDVRVVIGANEIAVDGALRGAHPGTGLAPQFALDVAQLGGMYAGRIFIVGTEAGLGVRNAGTLSATRAALTLSVDGQLHNSGAIASNGAGADLDIAAQGIANSGTLTSQQDLRLADGGAVTTNSGTLQAQRQLMAQLGHLGNQPTGVITAQRLEITAATLSNAGSMTQTGAQDLHISSATLASTGDQAVLGAHAAPVLPEAVRQVAGHRPDERQPAERQPAERESADSPPPPSTGQEGSLIQAMPAPPLVLAPGRIEVVQHLDNTGALLANGATDLRTTQALTNSGSMQVRQLHTDGLLDNSHGTLHAQQLSGTHDTLLNCAGALHVARDLKLFAEHIDNTGGTIGSAQSLAAEVGERITNDAGTLSAATDLALSARNLDNNDQGRIVSNTGSVRLAIAQTLNNRQGQITTASDDRTANIEIQAANLDSTQGVVHHNGSGQLDIRVTETLRSDGAQVLSNGRVGVTADRLSNDGGAIQALQELAINARAGLSNVAGRLVAGEGTLQLQAGGRVDNRSGHMLARGDLQVTAGDLDNTEGKLTTTSELQLHSDARVLNTRGELQAQGAMRIHAGQLLDNQSGQLTSGADGMHLEASAIDNRQGQILSAQDATVHTQQLDNRQGTIAQQSAGQLRINAASQLNNAGGRLISHGALALRAGETFNTGGEIASQRDADLQVARLDSAQGLIQSGETLKLQSHADINNHRGRILAQGALNVTAVGALINTEGQLQGEGAATVTSAALDNSAGTLSSTQAMVLHTRVLTNVLGTLAASQALELHSSALDNTAGNIGAASIVIATAEGALTNDNGRIIASQGNVSLQTGALHSHLGVVQAAGDMHVNTHGQTLTNTGTLLSLGDASIDAGELNNTGGTLQAGGDAATGPSALTINAAGAVINDRGTITASAALNLQSAALDNTSGKMGAASIAIDTREGALTNDQGQIIASQGNVNLQTGALHSGLGLVQAAEHLEINTHGQALTNTGTLLALGNTTINAAHLNNTTGTISAGQVLTLSGTSLDNTTGKIGAASIAIDTREGALTNDQGQIIASQGNVNLQTGALHSGLGLVQAAEHLDINTHGQALTNTGKLLALGNATINAAHLNNTTGTISAGQVLTLTGTSLDNTAGKIGAASMTIDTQSGALTNDKGQIIASQGNVNLQTGALHSDLGLVQAAEHLEINTHGQALTNTGKLLAQGNATLNAAHLDNTTGTISAGHALTLTSTSLDNTSGEIGAASIALNTQEGALTNRNQGKITASAGGLNLQSGALHNGDGLLQAAQDLTIDTHDQRLSSTGTLLALGKATVNAGVVDNTTGTISAAKSLTLTSKALDNTSGEIGAASIVLNTQKGVLTNGGEGKIIASEGVLNVQSGALHNGTGRMQAATALDINTNDQLLTNTGTLLSLGHANVTAGDVDNTTGTILAADALNLTGTALDNTAGKIGAASIFINTQKGRLTNGGEGKIIASEGMLNVQSGALHNGDGLLQTSQHLAIHTHDQELTNTGTLLALGNATITAAQVNNITGTISAAEALTLTSTSLDNTAGTIGAASIAINTQKGALTNGGQGKIVASEGQLNVQSGALHNGDGRLQATKDLIIDTHGQALSSTGRLLALGKATIHAGAVNNTTGTIAAAEALQLTSTALDNTSGEIGAASIVLNTQKGALSNDKGKIFASQGNVNLQTGALHNDLGLVQAAEHLDINTHGQALTNTGTLLALGNVTINAGDAKNTTGTIAAGQALTLTSTALDNTSGEIGAATIVLNTQQGALTNRNNGKIIASEGGVDVQSGALHNGDGRLQAAQDLTLNTHDQTLSSTGTLLALGNATIDAGIVDNTTGTISAAKSLTLTSKALDNTSGEIGAASIVLTTQQGTLTNRKKGKIIASAGGLNVQSGALDNGDGRLQAAKDLTINTHDRTLSSAGTLRPLGNATITAGDVNNTTGTISAGQALTLTGTALDNTSGKIGAASVAINTQLGLLTNDHEGKIIASDGELNVQSGALHNDKGLLQAAQALTLNTHGQSLTNTGTLRGFHAHIDAGPLNNAGGDIAADTSLDIKASALDNRAGRVQAAWAAIDTRKGTLHNDAGHIATSTGKLEVKSGGFHNGRGVVHAAEDLEIRTDGQALNNSGTMRALGNARIHTGTLDNSGGHILAGGPDTAEAKLTVTATGHVNNSAGHMLARGKLKLTAPELNNSQGEIGAGGVLDARVAGTVINTAGQLVGDSKLVLNSASLQNDQQAVISSSAGPVHITTGAMNNHSSSITARHATSITSQGLDNTQGTISGDSLTIDTQGQQLTNVDAKLLATGSSLRIDSGNLDNQRGRIAAQQDAVLTAQGINNRAGRVSASTLRIHSQDASGSWAIVDNQAGSMLADQHLQIDSGALNNTAGAIKTTRADSRLVLDSHGADITNHQSGEDGGIVSAGALEVNAHHAIVSNRQAGFMGAAGDAEIKAERIENQGGVMASDSLLQLTSNADTGTGIDNSEGGLMQSPRDVRLHAGAATIMNTRGSIRANNDVLVQSRGHVENAMGDIKAGNKLSVVDAQVASGAPLSSAQQTLNNRGGTLFSGTDLSIRSKELTGASSLQSQGGMQLELAADYIHQGTLHVDGHLRVASSGNLINQGVIKGGSAVTVSAGRDVSNQNGAEISSAGVTTVHADHWLYNRGQINGGDTRLNASVLDNAGEGRIYGDHLSIEANEINNRAENGRGAVIAARQELDIGATVVNNQDGADILSMGNMRFGRSLGANRMATGKSQSVNNHFAKIDAAGSINFSTEVVNNTNAGLDVSSQVHQGGHAGTVLYQINDGQPEGGEQFKWIEKEVKIPFYNNHDLLGLSWEIPYSNPGRGLVKVAHPDEFLETIPLAVQGKKLDNKYDGGYTVIYTYEPNNSERFSEYGIDRPNNYNSIPPTVWDFGGIDNEDGLYWGRNSNKAGCEQAVEVYKKSVEAAWALNKEIIARNKEFNRIEGFWQEFKQINNVKHDVYRDQVVSSRPGTILAGGDIIFSGALNNIDSTVIAGGGVGPGKPNNKSTHGFETTKVLGTAVQFTLHHSKSSKNCFKKKSQIKPGPALPFSSQESRSVDLNTAIFLQNHSGSVSHKYVDPNGNTGKNAAGDGIAVTPVALPMENPAHMPSPPSPVRSGAEESAQVAVADSDVNVAGHDLQAATDGIHPVRPERGIGGSVEQINDVDLVARGFSAAFMPQARRERVVAGGESIAPTPTLQSVATSIDLAHAPVTASTDSIVASSAGGAMQGIRTAGTAIGPAAVAAPVNADPDRAIVVSPAQNIPEGAAVQAAVALVGPLLESLGTETAPAVTMPPAANAAGRQVEIRTSALPQYLPRSSLYIVNAGSPDKPLVETDPAFIDYKSWLSSDHMVNALSLDPALLQKRLGDGFYEQQLVKQQVGQLTGRRFLGNYRDDDTQYLALLQNGVTFARSHALRPGIALNPQQVAQLTSDLVWLVNEEISLSDGTVQTVLVPKVYVVAKVGDLETTGALISGDTVFSSSREDFHNSGTIAGRRAVVIEANDINNIGGRIVGESVALIAERDINVVGGTVSAALSLMAKAGNDINVITTTSTNRGGDDANGYANTTVDRIAGLILEPGDGVDVPPEQRGMVLDAGRNANLQAALIANAVEGASTHIKAAKDVVLSTVNISNEQRITWDPRNLLSFGHSEEMGTEIQTLGHTRIEAGENFDARAAQVHTSKALEIKAAKDVKIAAGEATQSVDSRSYSKSKGLFSSSTSTRIDQLHATQSLASSLGGNTVDITSGANVKVLGSQVISDHGTKIEAASDVLVLADTEKTSQLNYQKNTKTGLFGGGGIGFTIGNQLQSTEHTETTTRSAGSTVGSIHGDVSISAGNKYLQEGSEVTAAEADLNVTAKSITVKEAQETREGETHTAFKQSGLSVTLSAPVLSLLQTASGLAETASQTGDARMQALALGAAALNVAKNKDALKSLADPDGPKAEVSLSITMGKSQSRSDSRQSSNTAQGSKLQARGKINLAATGDGENSNILVQGSDIVAINEVELTADNDINLLAARHTSSDRSNNSNSSAAVGVAVTLGQGGASFGITASAQTGQGRANSDDVVHRNTHITAGKTTFKSGRDTALRGAKIDSNKVVGNVGGSLKLESLQDTSIYAARQQSMGASGTFGAGFSASGNYSNSRASGNFSSVGEQTAIHAGDGGFELNVKQNTDLKGAVITSSQAAIDQELNSLTTGTLTHSDIENHSDYKASGISMSGGFSVAGDSSAAKDGKTGSGPKLYDPGKTGVTGAGFGASSTSGSEHSITRSGISLGKITITDEVAQQALTGQSAAETIAGISREVLTGDEVNGLNKKWDGQALMREQAARAKIIEAFGQQAGEAIGSYCEGKANALQQQAADAATGAEKDALLAEAEKWAEGGGWRVALHTIVGGLGGGLRGAMGAAGAASAAPLLDEFQGNITAALENVGMGQNSAKIVAQLTAGAVVAGLGAVVGNDTAVAAALNSDFNNRQLHEIERKWIKNNAKRYAVRKNISIDQAEMELTAQANRQVQAGSSGVWDKEAGRFLKEAGQITLPADGDDQKGYMFYAEGAQKNNPEIYAYPASHEFWGPKNRPSDQEIYSASEKHRESQNLVGAATIAAPVASIALVTSPLAAAGGVLTHSAISGSISVGMDAVGQYYKDGKVRAGQTLFVGAVGAVAGPVGARVGFLNNILLGGSAGAIENEFNNFYYTESSSSINAALYAGFCGGLGYGAGDFVSKYVGSKVPKLVYKNLNPKVPALFQRRFVNPVPGMWGGAASAGVGGGSAFIQNGNPNAENTVDNR